MGVLCIFDDYGTLFFVDFVKVDAFTKFMRSLQVYDEVREGMRSSWVYDKSVGD